MLKSLTYQKITKKKPKDRIIRDIWNIFGTEQEKKKERN